MHTPFVLTDRRRFIATLALGAAAFTVRGAFAEQLARTAAQTEGPFYPDRLPLDTDNDLIIMTDGLTPAVGEVTHLSGRILDETLVVYQDLERQSDCGDPLSRVFGGLSLVHLNMDMLNEVHSSADWQFQVIASQLDDVKRRMLEAGYPL